MCRASGLTIRSAGIGERRPLPVDQPGAHVLRQVEGDEQASPGALEPLLGHGQNANPRLGRQDPSRTPRHQMDEA